MLISINNTEHWWLCMVVQCSALSFYVSFRHVLIRVGWQTTKRTRCHFSGNLLILGNFVKNICISEQILTRLACIENANYQHFPDFQVILKILGLRLYVMGTGTFILLGMTSHCESVLPTKKLPNRGASTSKTAAQGSQVAQFPVSPLKLHWQWLG